MTWLLSWAGGFSLLTLAALVNNHRSPDPADHWPPGCVVLFALWPLLLLVSLVMIVGDVAVLICRALEQLRGRR
jgi:hypothetical protein